MKRGIQFELNRRVVAVASRNLILVAVLAVVSLLAGCPERSVTVPSVIGMTQSEAETAIRSAGLTVGTVTHESSQTVPAGNVISQVPEAGTRVNSGTGVNLVVSDGPQSGEGEGEGEGEIVGGTLEEDTVWQGDILVTDTIEVPPDIQLTILPGTRVQFQHYRGYRDPDRRLSIQNKGCVTAEGTADEPIYFTSDADDPQNGDWSMVRLISSCAESSFRYCVFEFAQHGLNVWQTSPEISHCVFRWNNWEGAYFESFCEPTLEYCQIYENGYNGLAAEQSNTITMDYTEIWRNGTNGFHIDNSIGIIRGSLIHDNRANGLSVDDGGTLVALGDSIERNSGCAVTAGEGPNTVQISSLIMADNGGELCADYTTIASTYIAPESIQIGFAPDQSYAQGYVPGDPDLDGYMYVYPDDETRRVVRKIGAGLGLTWSLGWDGEHIWTCTLWGNVYELDPTSGTVLDSFILSGSSTWGTPTQPWGMTFDDEGYMWLADFAERKLFQIDLSTRDIIFSFNTPEPSEGGCKGLAWDGTYLNVMGWTSSVIYQMTKSGSLANTIHLDNGGGGGLAWDGQHFWVPCGGRILEYDAMGHQVGWVYAASEGTWDMTWDGAYLWATQRTNENWPDPKIFQLELLDIQPRE